MLWFVSEIIQLKNDTHDKNKNESISGSRPQYRVDDNRGSDNVHVSVVDVVGETSTIVKQIRIHAKPGTVATIASDRKGGGGVSASAGSQPDRTDQGIVTILVLADHVEWEAGNVNAIKFLISASSKGATSRSRPKVGFNFWQTGYPV